VNEIYESFSGYLNEDSKKFLVAFSGGLDSTVLLHALKKALVKEKLNKEILAIHVDHKQNKNSKNWIEHCKKFCETIQVSFACSLNQIKQKSTIRN
jgi:Predicted ATPase of the PP-loop superfamily implicated in cell cycle control